MTDRASETRSRRSVLKGLASAYLAHRVTVGAVSGRTQQRPSVEKWHYETGARVRCSPAVVNGTVYIGNEHELKPALYAVDAATGRRRWSFEVEDYIRSSPVVVQDTVYVVDYIFGANLYALSAKSGREYWRYDLNSRTNSSPIVYDGTVFVGSAGRNSEGPSTDNESATQSGGAVHAIDATRGSQNWHVSFDGMVNSSPVAHNGTVIIGCDDGTLHALSAETGNREWQFETGGKVRSSPTVHDGTVYVGSDDGSLYAVDVITGEQRWQFETAEQIQSSPTVYDGTVYVGGNTGILYAVDLRTGTVNWEFESENKGPILSSPTVAGQTVFVGGHDGILYAVNTSAGQLRWKFETGEAIASSPIVVDGTVYVGSNDGNVYAVETGAGQSSKDSRVTDGSLGHHQSWVDNVGSFPNAAQYATERGRDFWTHERVATGAIGASVLAGVGYAVRQLGSGAQTDD